MTRSRPRAWPCLALLALPALSAPAAAQPYAAPPREDGRAEEPPRPDPPRLRPRPERETISANYLQLTMGFLAGGRRYNDAVFEDQNGGAPALVEPFGRAPFDGVTALGLRYDLRATVSYVRATIGFDVPFPDFRTRDTTGTYQLNGKSVSVTAQSLRPYELRFGIGAEYPIWLFAPFIDLMGYAYWADAALTVDDQKAEYRARGFGFSLRGGARVHMKEWFFLQAAGEAGLYGPVRWNAELSIGFAVPARRRRY